MQKTFLAILGLLAAGTAFAVGGPWEVKFRDQKLPTQEVMEHKIWVNPIAASSGYLKVSQALSSTAATTVTSFLAQPDFPRNITLTPTGTTSSVGSGTAVVSGKNIFGSSISENFTITSAQSTATTGAKAFKSVSSVVFPQAQGAGATLSVGVGSSLGMRHCVDNAGDYVFDELGGVYASTRGTLKVSSTVVESNTFAPNGSMDGTKNVDLFYVNNFRCFGQ